MKPDHEMIAEWLAAQWRIRREARTEAGRQALAGEWMMLHSQRDPEIAASVETLCASINREWGRR